MTDEERAYNYASKQKASKFQIGEIAKFYNDGYQQAEEDNKLSWKDIEKICLIAKEVHQFRGFWSESVYQEVLKRFNKGMRNKADF
jgi:hypothetical protein